MNLDVAGRIFFLEINRAAELSTVDRALTQLRYSGALDGFVAVVVAVYEYRGWTMLDISMRSASPSSGVCLWAH